MQDKQKLRNLIKDAAGNVFYTFAAHWIIVNRLKSKQKWIKIFQIGLTALSTGGFLASILSGVSCLSWLGGLFSAFALALNLYVHEFNIPDDIQKHVDAANELWDVREAYKSLLIDFESLTDEEMAVIAKLNTGTRYYHRNDEQLAGFAAWKPEFEKE